MTKHADIVWLSKQPRRFLNEPRLAVFPEGDDQTGVEEGRHLLIMDPPMHAQYRKLVSSRFTPGALRRREAAFEQIAQEILDDIATEGETAETDFVEKVASVLPLSVIADMLGVPRADWKLLFRWTNSAARRSARARRSACSTRRPTATRRSSTTPSPSGSTATRTPTTASRSGARIPDRS